MASITLPARTKREPKSERETAVPVRFTHSGTPYVESAVAVMPPQRLREAQIYRRAAHHPEISALAHDFDMVIMAQEIVSVSSFKPELFEAYFESEVT